MRGPVQRQCVVIVLDSVGIGEMPDAAEYGDEGADTLGGIAATQTLLVPALADLGLGLIARDKGRLRRVEPVREPTGAYGRMAELSKGKDSATGHWELMGLVSEKAFTVYPDGFPEELIDLFIEKTGVPGVLANRPASGTVVIEQMGRQHEATGKPIVYTSADPVFQIAAHESIIPLPRLYEICQQTFEFAPEWGLSRVIARPFVGKWPRYTRTANRKDFTVAPQGPTVLDKLASAGLITVSIGKVGQLFAQRGITRDIKTRDNAHGVAETLAQMKDHQADLIFVNLVEFDSEYGHRRDPAGYARALTAFDDALPALREAQGPEDLLLITADHGNDPTFRGTDHTREYVPVLASGAWVKPVDLGTRASFGDLGATVGEFLGQPGAAATGTSFLAALQGS